MLYRLWQAWLSVEGKKTKAGMILLGIALVVKDPALKQALNSAGQILGGVGIGDWAGRGIGEAVQK